MWVEFCMDMEVELLRLIRELWRDVANVMLHVSVSICLELIDNPPLTKAIITTDRAFIQLEMTG
jgi:hypothetical protein